MIKLNLPEYTFKTKTIEGEEYIFDKCRKRYVKLTPEEWVRQNFLNYLIIDKKYPESLISVEHSLKLNKLEKRGDIVVFNRQCNPYLIVECKAPDVNINQKVFDQIANYNMKLNAKYLVVTNGIKHYCCVVDAENKKYSFLNQVPPFEN